MLYDFLAKLFVLFGFPIVPCFPIGSETICSSKAR